MNRQASAIQMSTVKGNKRCEKRQRNGAVTTGVTGRDERQQPSCEKAFPGRRKQMHSLSRSLAGKPSVTLARRCRVGVPRKVGGVERSEADETRLKF